MIANSPTYRLAFRYAFAKIAAAQDMRRARAGDHVAYTRENFRANRYFDEADFAAMAAALE